MIKRHFRLIAFLFTIGVAMTQTASAQTPATPPRMVTASGEGIIRVQPDVAILRFGVVTRAETAEEARQQNAEAAARAMNAVRELGVPERNIRLESLRLYPRTEWDPQAQRQIELGYEAVRDVVVRLENLELLPDLVVRVVDEGANRLNGIEYDLSNREAVRNQALQEALRNARAKAELMTSTLNVGLGSVVQISEQAFDFPRPVYRGEMAYAMAKADVAESQPDAYAAGEIEVRAVVQVAFALQ